MTRNDSRRLQAELPTYLQKLVSRVQSEIPPDDGNSAILAYTALLSRALEDRQVDDQEAQALVELATHWAIPPEQIQKTNWSYLFCLAAAALADGVVTDAERRDLRQVACLLGIAPRNLEEMLEKAAQKMAAVQSPPVATAGLMRSDEFVGKNVCFTGECQCRLNGESITRETAMELASRHGMIVSESVTKKLDLLVVADALTQSGKAKKARQYGIRVLYETVFWKALGMEVG